MRWQPFSLWALSFTSQMSQNILKRDTLTSSPSLTKAVSFVNCLLLLLFFPLLFPSSYHHSYLQLHLPSTASSEMPGCRFLPQLQILSKITLKGESPWGFRNDCFLFVELNQFQLSTFNLYLWSRGGLHGSNWRLQIQGGCSSSGGQLLAGRA